MEESNREGGELIIQADIQPDGADTHLECRDLLPDLRRTRRAARQGLRRLCRSEQAVG